MEYLFFKERFFFLIIKVIHGHYKKGNEGGKKEKEGKEERKGGREKRRKGDSHHPEELLSIFSHFLIIFVDVSMCIGVCVCVGLFCRYAVHVVCIKAKMFPLTLRFYYFLPLKGLYLKSPEILNLS